MKPKQLYTPLRILLADDDKDDRFFFKTVLNDIPIETHLTTVFDGEQLIDYLSKNSKNLPDVLFLDLNMPRKNGHECLVEIKLNEKFKQLPIIIYSTSLDEMIAEGLYKNGAYHYIRKTNLTELQNLLHQLLTMMKEKKFIRPTKNKFILNLQKV